MKEVISLNNLQVWINRQACRLYFEINPAQGEVCLVGEPRCGSQ